MSAYVITEAAVAQAIGLCYLAREPGLPEIHMLRVAVVQLHNGPCGWCDYPTKELLAMLEPWNRALRAVDDALALSAYRRHMGHGEEWREPNPSSPVWRADQAWWALPGKARLRAIAFAAGREDES